MVILILKNYKKLKNTVYICTKRYKNLKKKKTRKQKFCIFYGLKYKGRSMFYEDNTNKLYIELNGNFDPEKL